LLEPKPYPIAALPLTIREAVAEVQSFVQAPVALVAASALSALSIAAQAHVDVARAEKLVGPVSLYMLSVAESGERKSTCDGHFTKTIHDYDREQAELSKMEIAKYEAEKAAWDAKKSGISESLKRAAKNNTDTSEDQNRLDTLERQKPVRPRVPRLTRGDETPENLAFTLAQEWPSAGILVSEGGLILGAHGMNKEVIMRNLGLLNILWDGGALPIGRRSQPLFTVRDARFTVGLQVQESVLSFFFEQSKGLARGIGFFARFLLSWPESTQGTRFYKEATTGWSALAKYNHRMKEILSMPVSLTDEGGLSPTVLQLSPEAKALWVKFHDEVEVELRKEGKLSDVRDVASKIADNAVRIAALFHMFEQGNVGSISADLFNGASQIASWHLNEALRFFGEIALPEELADAVRLNDWLVDYCKRHRTRRIARRETQRKVTPIRLRKKARLNAALEELGDAGCTQQIKEGKKNLILVNPVLLQEGT
jgi:putative DNA primase/helicase